MPDPYEQLPADDESPIALSDDARAYLRTAVPGWEVSDGAAETAILAASADEGATLYALNRDSADDKYRDFGTAFLGVPAGEPAPASTTTTWTARAAAPPGGRTILAGDTLVIQSAAGPVGFEVLTDTVLAEGNTVASGVIIQALEAGTTANGATGTIDFDEPPAWVLSVTLDAPATGGTDGDTPEEHSAKIRTEAQLLSRAPILPEDFARLAQRIDEISRTLVLDLYDDDTDLSDQERTVSLYPIQIDGTATSPTGKAALEALILARREQNWIVRVADPTYTTVDLDITVAAEEGADFADVQARVETAIADTVLNPARHGQPPLGERLIWRQRRTIRQYEVASTADNVEGVAYVDTVAIDGADVDGNLELAGPAPLPLPGTITVTVIAAE